jgi:hypothetical protein
MAGYATDTVVTLTAVPDESKRCVGWRGTCRLALGPTRPCMLFHVLVDSQAHRGGAGLSRSFGEGPRTSIPDDGENARLSGAQDCSACLTSSKVLRANVRTLHCVASGGVVCSVAFTIASTFSGRIRFLRPGRGASFRSPATTAST